MFREFLLSEAPPDPPSVSAAGYCLHEHIFRDAKDDLSRLRIALPQPLSAVLIEEYKQREAQRLEEEQAALAAEREARRAGSLDVPPSSLAGPRASSAMDAPLPNDPPARPRGTVPAFDWSAARERLLILRARPDSPDKELIKRDIGFFEQALQPGPWRRVGLPRHWRARLASLAVQLPHFAPVVDFVSQRLALAHWAGQPVQPPPILLLGDPGVGKTHFTHCLGEILDAPVHRESFDGAEHSGNLQGSSRRWANTTPGALFHLIVIGRHANPIVLLDELDKGGRFGNQVDPRQALLSLLEPVSSTRVRDRSVEFEFDASHVWYIATANDVRQIPGPLRSRFTQFTIREPDIDGRLALAHAIWASTLARLVPRKSQRARLRPLTNLQVCRLAWLTPRQIRQTAERVLGAAALAGRWHIEDTDFDAALAGQEAPRRAPVSPAKEQRRGPPDDPLAIVVLPLR